MLAAIRFWDVVFRLLLLSNTSTNVKYFRSFSNRTKHGTRTSLTRFPVGLYKNRRKDVDRVNSLLSYHIWDKQVDVICTCNGRLSVNLFVV